MVCNCKAEIEEALLARFKLKYPDAQGHKVSLEGYGFAIVGNSMTLRPFMPIKLGAGHANKRTGLERWKNEKGTMGFRFCPFCGTNLSTEGTA